MTKSELIQRLADQNPNLFRRDIERIVTTIFDEISYALYRGGRVELRGFGAFSVKERAERVGRNPRTGKIGQCREEIRAVLQGRQGFARPAERGLLRSGAGAPATRRVAGETADETDLKAAVYSRRGGVRRVRRRQPPRG